MDPDIGLLYVGFVLVGRIVEIGFLADQQVHVSHGVVVILINLERFVQILHPIVDHRGVLFLQFFFSLLVLQRTGLFRLHAQVGARFHPGCVPLHPVDHGQAVEAFLALRIGRDQFQIPLFGIVQLLQFLLEIRHALRLLVAQGSQRCERRGVVRMVLENLDELFLRLLGQLHVVRRFGAGDVLAHVGGGEVKTAVDVGRIQVHGFLEELHRVRIPGAFIRLNAFVDAVARPQLVAARRRQKHQPDAQYE